MGMYDVGFLLRGTNSSCSVDSVSCGESKKNPHETALTEERTPSRSDAVEGTSKLPLNVQLKNLQ